MFEDGIIHYIIIVIFITRPTIVLSTDSIKICLQMKQSHNSYKTITSKPNTNGIIHSIEETTQNCPTRDSHSFLLHILLFVKPFHCDSSYTNNNEDDMTHELN